MTTALYKILLSPGPQAFAIDLAGVTYRLRIFYADAPEAGWILDLLTADGAPLVCGIPLVPGVDLLEQYTYLSLGFGLRVVSTEQPDEAPSFDALGRTSQLFAVLPA